MKNNYYAIQNNGYVFTSWKECEKYVKGRNVKFKKFKTLEECKEYSLTHKYKIINKSTKSILKVTTMSDILAKKLKGYTFNSELERTVALWLVAHNIKFKTQFDTLKCVNPSTGNILPYDFELSDYSIIIEVQGMQHYKAGVKFNTNIEELEYQQAKDRYKKKYAIDNGYTFIELSYDAIRNGNYIAILERNLPNVNSSN